MSNKFIKQGGYEKFILRTSVVVPARYVDEEIYKDAHIIIEKYKITLNNNRGKNCTNEITNMTY